MYYLFIEAIIVGIAIVVVGTLVSLPIGILFSVDLPPVCKNWNKNYIMEMSLFLTGFLTYLLFEVLDTNKWHCKNGYACKK